MLISCLTITQPTRLNYLERCLQSFAWQTFDKNLRELIIIHCAGESMTNSLEILLDKYGIESNIYRVDNAPLGELRNFSTSVAVGQFLCPWDDDDFFHPERLEVQSELLKRKGCTAVTLTMQLFWFVNEGTLYIRRSGKEGLHGSIMFRKDAGLKYDSSLSKGEDTLLIDKLIAESRNNIFSVDDRPELFVRTCHGGNTWSYEHHSSQIRQALDSIWLKSHENQIRSWVKIFNIPKVNICDANSNVVFQVIP
jgi:glycosyltransferase involved in cell wall biosynthesis